MTPPPSPGEATKPRGMTGFMKRTWRGLRKRRAIEDIIPIKTIPIGSTDHDKKIANLPRITLPETTTTIASAATAPTNTTIPVTGSAVLEIDPNLAKQTQTRQEQARALFAKHGLVLEDHEWMNTSRAPVERVEKPIRIRVRHQCHRCQTIFGPKKTCENCQHPRCQECPRYPLRKSNGDSDAGASKPTDTSRGTGSGLAATEVGVTHRPATTVAAILQSPEVRLYHKSTLRLVRRTCHMCGENYGRPKAQCDRCQHVHCVDCPEGFPEIQRDHPDLIVRQYKKPRIRVRWTCHSCSHLFQQGNRTCANCNHDRCDICTRQPPEKPKQTFEADVLRNVEERMRRMSATLGVEGPAQDDD